MLKRELKPSSSYQGQKQKKGGKKQKKMKKKKCMQLSVQKNGLNNYCTQFIIQKQRLKGQQIGFLQERKQSYLKSCMNKRKRALIQITKQNHQLYRKINSQQSQYSSQKIIARSYISNKSIQHSRCSKRINDSSQIYKKSKISKSLCKNISKQNYYRHQNKNLKIESHNIKNLQTNQLDNFKKMFQVKSEVFKNLHEQHYQSTQDKVSKIPCQQIIIEQINGQPFQSIKKNTDTSKFNKQISRKRRVLSAVQRREVYQAQKVNLDLEKKIRH